MDTFTRLRRLAALCIGVALMHTTMIGASTIGTLLAADIMGSAWSGVPNTAGVLGTAAGTLWLSALMARRGRRFGLLFGYLLAAVGAVVATAAVVAASMPTLLMGMGLLGVGNGAGQLSRYAAADLYPPGRRSLAIGIVVWTGTVAGVAGPSVISPTADAAAAAGIPPFAGAYVLAVLMTAIAAAAMAAMPRVRAAATDAIESTATPWREVFFRPRAQLALAAIVTGQLVMVAVMTMAPLHIHQAGHGLDAVGLVISIHILGMFALSPLSGWFASRYGATPTIVAAVAVLATAAVMVVAAPGSLPVALFLLGYGWNLSLVGGSSLLASGAGVRAQGVVDSLAWGSSAIATLASGALFAVGGYSLLGAVSGAVLVWPVVMLVVNRRADRTDQRAARSNTAIAA
jgi:MFS family permease